MATNIIAALRARTDLKRTVLDTAIQMAHMASIYGVLRKPHGYIAQKCRCSKQTIITHIAQLRELKIMDRSKRRKPGSYVNDTNVYTFVINWRGKPPALHKGADSKETWLNLPTPPKEIPEAQLLTGMKDRSFADLIRGKLRVLHYMTEGTQWYQALKEEIDTLIANSRWAGKDLDKLLQEG